MSDFSLSLSDLILIGKFAKAFGEDDKQTMYEVLYENGMDIVKGVEEVVCQHRNLQGKVANCLRFEGAERCDKDWLSTGAASLNAHIKSCNDVEQRMALRMMSREGSSDGSWV